MVDKPTGDELAREARELLEEDWRQDRENRQEGHRDLEFIAGQQWPGDVQRDREANNRPTLTINRLPQFVNQVVNDFRINAPAISVIPVDNKGDPELAEIYNGMLRAIQYVSNATHVWSSAFSHSVQCGIGHFRVVTDYAGEDSFDQELCIKRIQNPLSVYWDSAAIEPDRSDAERCFVTEMIPKRVFEKRWPKAGKIDFITPDFSNYSNRQGFFWNTTDAVRVAEYWRKVPEKRRLVRFVTGEVMDITGLKQADLVFLPQIEAEREAEGFKIEHCIVSGGETLEKVTTWPGKWIPIVPVIGQEIPLGDKVMRHGLVRFARDPQQLYNYWRSAAAETIALAPRAPFMATPDMIGPYKDMWDSHHLKNRPYLLYKPDPQAPGAKPQREPPPAIPAALLQESAIASDDMKATTGLYDPSLGQKSNETSGKAINARQREGDVATYHFRDNFNVSLSHCGRILVDLIPKIYDTERVVRLMEEESEDPKFTKVNQQVMAQDGAPVLRNDLRAGKFDVRVKLGPSYTTRRQEAADSMLQFIQAFPAAGAVTADLVAQSMDWPKADKFAERLKRVIPPQVLGEDADQPDPAQQEAAAKAMQYQELAADLEIALKKQQVKKAEAETHDKAASATERDINAMIQLMGIGMAPMAGDPFGHDGSQATPQALPSAPAPQGASSSGPAPTNSENSFA